MELNFNHFHNLIIFYKQKFNKEEANLDLTNL